MFIPFLSVYASLVPPKFSHLYLRITCASKDHLRLRPPHLRLRAPHLRLHFFLTCASLLLIQNVCTLSFHNAMILNLVCYLNFIPPCPPQWLYLNPNSFFKLPTPCLPQCYHLKSNSLFKLPPLVFHNAINLNLTLYLNFPPPCLPQCYQLKSTSLFKLPPPCLPQCYHLKSNSLFKLYPPLPSTMPSSKIQLFV